MATFAVTVPDDVYEEWRRLCPEETVDEAVLDTLLAAISWRRPEQPKSLVERIALHRDAVESFGRIVVQERATLAALEAEQEAAR